METENAHDAANAARRPGELAIALTGGGARAAYQVGLLVWLARRFPDLEVPILTGVSAGAVNAAHLAAHPGNFRAAVSELARMWSDLTPEDVFRVDTRSLAGQIGRWAARLTVGGFTRTPAVRGLVDTTPLRRLLEDVLAVAENGEIVGIAENLRRGRLKAIAVSTTSYGTGRSVAWAQGREIHAWERPDRAGIQTALTVDHIMASAALPLFFPAVRLGDDWHGDGGIRLAARVTDRVPAGVVSTQTGWWEACDELVGHEVVERGGPATLGEAGQGRGALGAIDVGGVALLEHELERVELLVRGVLDHVDRDAGVGLLEEVHLGPVELGRPGRVRHKGDGQLDAAAAGAAPVALGGLGVGAADEVAARGRRDDAGSKEH